MSQVATTYSGNFRVSEMTGEQLLQTLEAAADNLFDPDLIQLGILSGLGAWTTPLRPKRG